MSKVLLTVRTFHGILVEWVKKCPLLHFINSSCIHKPGQYSSQTIFHEHVPPSVTLASNSQGHNINIATAVTILTRAINQVHPECAFHRILFKYHFSHSEVFQNSVWLELICKTSVFKKISQRKHWILPNYLPLTKAEKAVSFWNNRPFHIHSKELTICKYTFLKTITVSARSIYLSV